MLKHNDLVYGSGLYNTFRQGSDTVAMSVTGKQCEALFLYTEMNFKTINQALNVEDFGSVAEQVNVLDSVFDIPAAQFGEVLTVFRAELVPAGVSVAEVIAERYPLGGMVNVKQFLSTSLCPSVPVGILENTQGFMVVVRTSKGVMLNDSTSAQGLREREVLLPRNCFFTVDSIEDSSFKKGSGYKSYKTAYLTLC